MVDIILSELTVALDKLHPDEKHFGFVPPVILSCLAVLYQVKQADLEVSEDHYQGIQGASAHDEVIYQLVVTQGLMHGYLVEPLLESHIPEAVETVDLGHVAVLTRSGDVEVGLQVLRVILVEDGAQGGLEVELDPLVKLEVSQ